MIPNWQTEIDHLGEALGRAEHIWITSHIAPDADGVSACLAMRAALHRLGKTGVILLADPVPSEPFGALPETGTILGSTAGHPEPDVIVVLDLSDLTRLGGVHDAAAFERATVVNIDHHISNTNFGAVNIVDPEAAATCELLAPVVEGLGLTIDREIATWLLTGLVSDTQGFRTSNTTTNTLRVAARLMDAGASLAEVSDAVFRSRPLSTLRLWGVALANVQSRADGRLIWTEITPELLMATGASPEEADGAINLLASTRGADATVIFKLVGPEEVKVSIRTTPAVNAAAVCAHFGGGGHARAAGCTLRGSFAEVQAQFLDYLETSLLVRELVEAGMPTSTGNGATG